ncbi:MAG: Hsp20/alpha crystallin family protein [Candidatus Paceibacterota bacterium]|jgi:HSP20 family protein
MNPSKKSFFERLTGTVKMEDESSIEVDLREEETRIGPMEQEESEGELSVDVYQTSNDIVVQTMVAGVKPEDLDINITRDMVTIRGKREEDGEARGQDYFHRELYWGSFSRTIMLPEEIQVEDAEAVEKHGLLTITLPKIDKSKQSKLRVKSS